jgi:hypothetical protein
MQRQMEEKLIHTAQMKFFSFKSEFKKNFEERKTL